MIKISISEEVKAVIENLEKRGSAWRKRIYRYFYGLVEGRNKQ